MKARDFIFMFAMCAASSTLAQDGVGAPHVLIDASLEPIAVKVLSVSSDSVTTRTETEAVRIFRLSDVAALIFSRTGSGAALSPGAVAHTLRLRDGRVYQGEIRTGAVAASDGFVFRSVSIGDVRVSLEDVSAVELSGGQGIATTPSKDTVRFRNGDIATGFVESVGGEVRLSGADGDRTFELSSILSIEFTNPPIRPKGMTIRTADETVACDGMTFAPDGQVSILRGGADAESPKIDITSVVSFIPDAGRIIALSDLPVAGHDRKTNPPRKLARGPIGQDIEVTGPVTVRWTLPEGAAKIAGELTLPESCRDWGDLQYRLSVGDSDGVKAETSGRLNGASHTNEFSLAVLPDSKTFTLTIESGAGGPIHDRIRLSRTVILVNSAAKTP